MSRLGGSLKHIWNAFVNERREHGVQSEYGGTYGAGQPGRTSLRYTNEKSIISSIYTRLSMDVASIDVRHVRTDDQRRYLEDMDSGLNSCLTLEANIDQAARAFRQDIAMTLFDKGVAAIVPVDTSISPETSGGYDIKTMRVGEVVAWFPRHVRVSLYNERVGIRREITIAKSACAIVVNPLYHVMNEPNSTLQRLVRKLSLLDAVDDASASGRLDIIIQLPYVIRTDARRRQAEQRRRDLEFQMKGSKYGVAYADGTERIIQLNRAAENNLMSQIEFLTEMLYTQLGLTPEVMTGKADEAAVLHYWNRTVEPVLTAIVEAMRPKFLTKTARSQKQTILFFRDPFKLVPIENIAEIADKFTRNEIMTSNEFRQVVGMRPAQDPKADQLVNSNMPQPTQVELVNGAPAQDAGGGTDPALAALDDIEAMVDDVFRDFDLEEVDDEVA